MREHPVFQESDGPGQEVARAIWLLNDPLRIAILVTLVPGGRCVGEVASLGWPQSQVSECLLAFAAAGWMKSVKSGRKHIYSLSGAPRVHLKGNQLIVELDADDGDSLSMKRTVPRPDRHRGSAKPAGNGDTVVRIAGRADSTKTPRR